MRVFKQHGQWCSRCELCPQPETLAYGPMIPWASVILWALRHVQAHQHGAEAARA